MKQEFINVNGKAYDPVTGLPLPISVEKSPTVAPAQPKRVAKVSTARGTTTATIHRVPVQKSNDPLKNPSLLVQLGPHIRPYSSTLL